MIAVAALPAITESGLPIRFSPRSLFCLTVASHPVYFPSRSSDLSIQFFCFSGLYGLAIRSGGTRIP